MLPFFDVEISLDSIARIQLSPWLPTAIVSTTREILKSIDGCEDLTVIQSTLTGNKSWKEAFREAAGRASQKGV
jgi:hypothetical protein